MTSTTFQGPVQTGTDAGAPATKTIGTLVATQRVTVASNTSGASSIVLPSCTIQDMILDVLVSASAGGPGVQVRVGTTADGTRFASIQSSAVGRYRLGVAPNVAAASAAALETVAGPQRLFIDVTAAGTANVDNYSGILTIFYVQR